MNDNQISRREFMRVSSAAAALGTSANATLLIPNSGVQATRKPVPPSDRVRFASIGTGVRGCEIMRAALTCPGTEVVAACDLYDGRLTAAREVAGKDIDTTKDYRMVLSRKDIDAVLVATPDHWHSKLVMDACAAGKDVYCEKPMCHTVDEGFAMVEAMNKYKRIVQVGSQRRSSILFDKAKEIIDSGRLGQITAIEDWVDRNDASGAWVYPIPPDASERTIDWNTFLGTAPKRDFDPKRFFRWRCYRDYGEGLPGDLFVHMLTGIHYITGITAPPRSAVSMGGLLRWTEDRDTPDLIWTLYDYPTYRLSLRCNLNNESAEIMRVFGTKATLEMKNTEMITVTSQDTEPKPESYSIFGWPEKLRREYLENWSKEHAKPSTGNFSVTSTTETFMLPDGYDMAVHHMNNFMESVRSRKPSIEDAVFGNNAAIACHMSNYAYYNKAFARWDPAGRKITG